MAVFRINKTRDYTVMSNYHLKDTRLSLKSKGLLSMMLSLPEEWNYTTRGLAAICKEGVDSIGTALKELERSGYIQRNRVRDEKGKITDTEYINKNMSAVNKFTDLKDKSYWAFYEMLEASNTHKTVDSASGETWVK